MPPALPLTRRRFVSSSLAVATTLQLQQAARVLGLSPATEICELVPEQEVGPYYVADELLRSDIAEAQPGVPLTLNLIVLDLHTCRPISNAALDIWHCNALGLYSGFTAMNPMGPGGPPPGDRHRGDRFPGPPPGLDPQNPGNPPGPPEGFGPPPQNHPTDKLTFCRGIQITGPDGGARFHTIFPGFYMGRTNHIHFKVRIGGHTAGHAYVEGHTSHIGQVFFPEDLTLKLMAEDPYTQHKIHRTTPAEDGVFSNQGGRLSIARLHPLNPASPTSGLRADLVAAVDPTATPAPVQRMGPGGPDRPPARSTTY